MKELADIEKSFVGTLIVNWRQFPIAVEAGVDTSWFTDDRWSLCWSALKGLFDRGELGGAAGVEVLHEAKRIARQEKERRSAENFVAMHVSEAINAGHVLIDTDLQILRNAAIERRAKNAIAATFKNFDVDYDSTDVVVEARNKLDDILSKTASGKKIPPRAIMDNILAEYREAHQMRVAADGPRDLTWTPGYKMPWPRMTTFLNGLRPGLHIIGARPSVGKTSFAINLMRFWCEQGYKVLFNELDMPRVEALRRFACEHARVSVRKASFSPTAADLDALAKSAAAVAAWPLSVAEVRDVDELRTLCMIERAAKRLDILVVDYLQLLHSRALGREDAVEYARVSYVSDTLKRLANELGIPVIALAQLNREVTKDGAGGRLPGLADLRGSGSIEQDAFTVSILHRDEGVAAKWRKGEGVERAKRLIPGTLDNPGYRYNLNDLDPVWWILCKAQNGPTGKLPFVVRKKYFAWMLADVDAEPVRTSTGYGATAREVVDNSPKFERVHADWRHDPLEEVLRMQLALIAASDVVEISAED